MFCKRKSPEVLVWRTRSWGGLPSAVHLAGWCFNFSFETGGNFVHGESFGMLNPVVLPPKWWQSCQDNCRRLTPSPHHAWYLDPRKLEWWISFLALAGLLENPWLNQKACLWYSSLSHKYYRCHFAAPKLLTRQHSYLIRHSTAIHIYLYLNSCPLYYTAGHASAPTPPY